MDDTQIANMTLQAIGSRSMIASLTEDSPEAYAINLIYAQTRNELLRKYPWNWARTQKYLAVLKSAQGTPANPAGTLPQPPLPWLYSYAIPSDCERIRYLLNIGTPAALTGVPLTTNMIQPPVDARTPTVKMILARDTDANGNWQRIILTNQYRAQIVYTGRVDNPNLWDDLFISSLIGRLAGKVSFGLSGDKSLTKMAIEQGQEAEGEAEKTNGDEGIEVKDWVPDFIQGRGYIDDQASNLYAGGGVIQDIS